MVYDGCDRRGDHLLSQFQGGFRRGRSCQHQSWVLSELIKSSARRGKKTYVAFLDVRKAYPTCRRAAMLERLYAKLAAAPGGSESYRPKLFSAVATMLRTENFRSKVVVDGAESAEYTVGHGLREGAVLSPGLSIGNLTNLGSGPVRTPNRTRVQELRNSDNPNSFMLVKRKEFHVAH